MSLTSLSRLSTLLGVLLILSLLPAAASAAADTQSTELSLTICGITAEAVPAGVFGDISIDGVQRTSAFVPKGSTVTVSVAAVPAGQTITVELSGAETFEMGADGKTVTVKNITAPDAHVKLIAGSSVTVIFDANGGTGGPLFPVSVTCGEWMPALTALPTAPGFTFEGYFDAASGGKKYYNKDGTAACIWDKAEAVTILYAQWTVNKTPSPVPPGDDKKAVINLEAVPIDGRVNVIEVDNPAAAVTFTGSAEGIESPPPTPGYKLEKVYAKFRITTEGSAGTRLVIDVLLPFGDNPQNVYLRHYTEGTGWDNTHIRGDAVSGAESGWQRFVFPVTVFSPFAVVYETPVRTGGSGGSSGFSVWLSEILGPETPAVPTPEPTPASGDGESTPLNNPEDAEKTQTSAPQTPAPIAGILAGLGSAAVLGLRSLRR